VPVVVADAHVSLGQFARGSTLGCAVSSLSSGRGDVRSKRDLPLLQKRETARLASGRSG